MLLKSLVQCYKPVVIWHHSTFTNLRTNSVLDKSGQSFHIPAKFFAEGTHSTGENTRQETQLANLGYETAISHEASILPAHLIHLVLHFYFFFFFGITQSTSPTCSLWVPTILWNKWCLKKVPPKQFPAVGFPHSLPPEIFVSYQRTGLKKCITEKFTLENASKILPWTHSSPSMSVLLWRAQKWTQDLRCGLISAQHRWQPLPWFCWPHYSCSRPGALGLLGHQHPQLLFL